MSDQGVYGSDLSWVAVSFVTGQMIAELPGLQVPSVEYHLMEGCTASGTLPWDGLPVNWIDAILPGGVALLLMQGETPIWGGLVMDAQRTPDGDGISLKLDTVESYLNACPVGDVSYTQQSQTAIAADLIKRYAIDGMGNCLTVDDMGSAILRDRSYKDDDDKSLLSALQELSGVIDGPEWGHWWTRLDDGSYQCVIGVADHYGSTLPVTDFDISAMAAFELDHDYSSGAGANRVRAVSTADGDVRPTSGWIDYKDPQRPVWPLSFTPSTSITDAATLVSHAQSKLDALKLGTRSITIGLDLLTAPRLGVEWLPGDVVQWSLTDAAERFPDASSGLARVIGYKVDWSGSWTLQPIIQSTEAEAGDNAQ